MPIDGSYGRLRAHNERLKMMRSKKKEKTDNSSRKSRFTNPEKIDKIVDQQKLNDLKLEIQKKGKIEKKKDLIFMVIMIVLSIVAVIFFVNWVISL